MAKTLEEYLKKCAFSEKERETLAKINSYSVKSNKEQLAVEIEASLSEYVSPEKIFALEKKIKKDYAVNRVTIFTKFENIRFDIKYFDDTVKILKKPLPARLRLFRLRENLYKRR